MRTRRRLLGLLGLLPVLAGCSGESAPAAPGGQLRLGAVLGETDSAGFDRADQPRRFRFPDDHGPHPGFRSEWWYLTFTLADPAGHAVGVQFTLFRQALAPAEEAQVNGEVRANRWQTNQIYLAHFAVTDVAARLHHSAERFARGHPRLAGAAGEPFRLWLEDWRLETEGDQWHLTADAGAFAVDLSLSPDGPHVLQGEQGLSRKGPDQASYYYSMPWIDVAGTVRIEGEARRVHGTAWLDREWSTSVLTAGQTGWDWFALQLADGRRVMLFQLRRQDGSRDPYDQGMLSMPGFPDRALDAADFELTPTRFWRDPDGIAWPVAWTVVLQGSERWQVEAMLDDQRMETTLRYWEGLVAVRDAEGHQIGRGYLELTGYHADEAPTGEGRIRE